MTDLNRGVDISAFVGPDTLEYAYQGKPLPFNKEPRDWTLSIPLAKYVMGGVPEIPKPRA